MHVLGMRTKFTCKLTHVWVLFRYPDPRVWMLPVPCVKVRESRQHVYSVSCDVTRGVPAVTSVISSLTHQGWILIECQQRLVGSRCSQSTPNAALGGKLLSMSRENTTTTMFAVINFVGPKHSQRTKLLESQTVCQMVWSLRATHLVLWSL